MKVIISVIKKNGRYKKEYIINKMGEISFYLIFDVDRRCEKRIFYFFFVNKNLFLL